MTDRKERYYIEDDDASDTVIYDRDNDDFTLVVNTKHSGIVLELLNALPLVLEQSKAVPVELVDGELIAEMNHWVELYIRKEHETDLETLASSIMGKLRSALTTKPAGVVIGEEWIERHTRPAADCLNYNVVPVSYLLEALGDSQ
jgi:hypothetical protein